MLMLDHHRRRPRHQHFRRCGAETHGRREPWKVARQVQWESFPDKTCCRRQARAAVLDDGGDSFLSGSQVERYREQQVSV